MKKAAILPLVLLLAGCRSDDADSLSRGYRNINNEAVDALMVVTSESRAKLTSDKIFKTYSDRLAGIDHRMDLWLQNTDDKQVVREVLTSESVAMLVAESSFNLTRLDLEKSRIKRLLATKVNDKVEQLRAAGDPNLVVDPLKEWPNIAALASGNPANGVKTNLNSAGRFGQLVPKFATKEWEKSRPPNFDDLMKAFDKRVKDFSEP